MKILVTGANGQVGHCLTNLLSASSHEYLALDRQSLDITDSDQVNSIVNNFKPDAIINAAAYTAVDKAETESETAYAINRYGVENLAKAADRVGAMLLHLSTDYVFSGNKHDPYSEQDAVCPQSVYGESKLAGEKAVEDYCKNYIILRTAWVFGEQGNNFVKTMLRLAKSRDELGVVGDQLGGPTYASDIAKALIVITEKEIINGNKNSGVYHFSGKPYVSWHQFAEFIFTSSQIQGVLASIPIVNDITTAGYPTPARRPANSCLDTSKITATFGIDSSDWQKALKNLYPYIT